PSIAGAGLFYDLAPHQLDLIVYFFGAPLSSYGMSANQAGLYTAEDAVTGLIRLPGNILFTGQWCFTTDPAQEEDAIVITGSKGSISFPVFGHTIRVLTGREEKIYEFIPPQHIQQPMIEKIVAYFSGQGENPCSAEQAIQSIQIMENFAYGN
ncbi:MAG: gfo/Idh/MocA family oxidoreductase, partial [Bacteroidota bacterium]|nr:gfo/Idh/MocA family oxidoreductase [Bacteroidota bacterium]